MSRTIQQGGYRPRLRVTRALSSMSGNGLIPFMRCFSHSLTRSVPPRFSSTTRIYIAVGRYHDLRLTALEARVHFLANFLEVCRLNHHGCPWSLRRVTNECRVGELTEGLHPDYQASRLPLRPSPSSAAVAVPCSA